MSAAREALRQQMLLRALWRDARPGVLAGWTRDGARFMRGLQVYQANAGALAERALAAAYPTVQQLMGAAEFAGMARALWQRQPPQLGDAACWGDGLGDFIQQAMEQAEQAARQRGEPGPDEPYLPDVARLEWAVHAAQSAVDDEGPPAGLALLAGSELLQLRLRARAGTRVIHSRHPIVSIWRAHCSPEPADAAPTEDAGDVRGSRLREALRAARPESAWVWRAGWRVEVAALSAAEAAFSGALLDGLPLSTALAAVQAIEAAAPPEDGPFSFEDWLVTALHRGWLAAVEPASVGSAPDPPSR
jgi:hypothetical protein